MTPRTRPGRLKAASENAVLTALSDVRPQLSEVRSPDAPWSIGIAHFGGDTSLDWRPAQPFENVDADRKAGLLWRVHVADVDVALVYKREGGAI